ncbi:MAG: SDR family NAD(P)-dependent oxidoreductase [Negativicutes bacterium]|nr:SDR family NAD(P)-dependent oxidoreductase [Negativicutes bacterium]
MRTANESTKQSLDIIIIGASGGIGQYLVRVFSKTNRIIGTYHSGSPINLEGGAEYFKVDVTNLEEVSNFFKNIGPSLSMPILIYSAGISPNNITLKISDKDWTNTIAVNLTGAMYCSREILPWMRSLNYGRLIFISSILSRIAISGTLAYSVTKAGLNAMAKVIAIENAARGITSNAIALGYFELGIINTVPKKFLNNCVIPKIPLKRLGAPDNICSTINYIIDSDYLTGSIIDLNGGIISK